MSNLSITKLGFLAGGCGSILAGLFGGWTLGLQVLLILMVIDFIAGFIVALNNKSVKSNQGGVSSNQMFKGICKKIFVLLMVVVGAQLDVITGTSYIKDAVVIAYVCMELVSIVENAGLIGLPIPDVVFKVIDVLKGSTDKGNNKDSSDDKTREQL